MTLQDEIRRRREKNLPALTAEEQRQFQQNLTDTAGRDLREAGRGTVKSTMKGTKVLDGPYKGLTRPQMEQSIITGAAPPTGKSGYVRGGELSPRSGQLSAPSRPASAAPPLPAGGRMVPGRSTGSEVYVPPGQKAWFENQPAPAPAPSAAPSAVQSLTSVPALGARPPLATARNAPAPAAPRAPGLINGQSAPQFFQETANRQKMPNSYGTIKPQSAPAPTRPVDPVLTEPRGFGAGPVAKPTAGVTPPAQDKLTPLIQSTQAMITQARTPATMPPSPTATRNGPPLVGLSAPKWQPATPVDGSGIADTMKNNQMIRPGFDKIIAAQKFPVPTAAMPKPASSSPAAPPQNSAPPMMGRRDNTGMGARPITAGASAPTARPAKTLQPPPLVMAR